MSYAQRQLYAECNIDENMLRDVLIAALIIVLIGVVLVPVSQLPKTEIRDRLVGKQTVPIPDGDTSFEMSLESNTWYQLSVKGGLIAPDDPVRIDITTPDNSSIHVQFPIEDPKSDFQTLEASGTHNFTFESAYAGANTRAEISRIISWEVITRPYSSFLYVGIAFVIVGTAFALFGLIYPVKTRKRS